MTTVYFKTSAFRGILLILTLQIIYIVVKVESTTCRTQPCLYFSHSKSLQSIEVSSSKVYLVLPSLKNVVAVDVHVRQNLVFWSETQPNAIKMLNITNGQVANVLSPGNLGEIEGLAVEWESGLLYWTDYTNRRIEVAQLDGQNRKILITKGVRNPRGISVDPRTGYVFWTSWGTRTRIQRASLSGHNVLTLVDLFNSFQFLPNGITLDFTENRLYWVDALFTQIESIDYNGNNRRHFALLPSNLHPYDIVLHGGVFYLSDWGSSYIERINKTNAARLPSYKGLGDGDVLGLAMFSQSRQPSGNTSCHSKNLCSHLCLLSPNGHQCACPTRTMLNADARTCDNNGISKFLLIVDEFQEAIYQFPLETKHPSPRELPLALDDVQNPIAVDYDPVESRLYWSDDDRGAIFRAQLDGGQQEQIVRKLRKPESIAVDSVGRNLYWTDSRRDRIEVSRLDGAFRKTLVYRDLDEPHDIILDVENGYMYWCQSNGFFPKIERANMDGTNRIVIQRLRLSVSPKRLALDRDHNRLYFIDELSKAIKFVTLGTGVTTTTTVVMRSGRPTGLAIHGSFIYWTERLGQGGSVYKADAGSAENIERIADGFQGPEDICVYGGNESIQSVNSGCKSNNGGCSHLCLLTPLGHRCACPNEMTLKDDMKTCHLSEFLLYADPGRKKIFKVDLDDPQTPKVALNLRNTQGPTALDFDPQESLIYWSDVRLDQILRSHPSGSAFQVVVASSLQSPRGIAVDFVARNLYWTDYLANKIEVSKLNGSYRKVLISQNLQSPMDIVLDMENGLMYWSCWGLRPKIERASMNGSNRTTIINLLTFWVQPSRPTGLALDPPSSRLYWVDSSDRHIQYTNLKRGDGTAVTVNVASRYLLQPYGLTLKENRLIWSDAVIGTGRIYSADKDSGGDVKQIVSNVMLAKDVHAYHNYTALPDDHPCALVNGWCTHLCLLVPGGYKCACPNSVASGIPCRTSPVPPPSSTIGFRSKTPETVSTSPSALSSTTTLPETSPSSRMSSLPLLSSSLSSQSSLFPSSSFRILHLSNPISSPLLVSTSTLSISSTKASTSSPTESSTTYPFSSSSTSSGPPSMPLSTSILLFPSVPSHSKPSMEASHSVADLESSSAPTSSVLPAFSLKNACIPNPCRNGGKCVIGGQGQLSCQCPVAYTAPFCELLIGNDSVRITFRMVSDEWEEETFKESIAKAFTHVFREKQWSFQARDVIHYQRRSAVAVAFKPSDVLVLSHVETRPSHLDVVTAVLVPSKDQSATRKTIPAVSLCQIVKESAPDISKYMGDHDVALINGESDPPCGGSKTYGNPVEPNENPGKLQSKSLSTSKTAGIVAGILMLLITLSAALYCWRARQRNVPWNRMVRRNMTPSFNNPGFAPDVQEPGSPGVEELPFDEPDYEEVPPAFPRNSLQTEAGSMSSTAEVISSTSFEETKEIPTRNNKDNINHLLPNVNTFHKMHERNAQRGTPLPSDLCNDIAERGDSFLRQANQTFLDNPIYEQVQPFGTSKPLANCNAVQEGGRSSFMVVEHPDSEYSSLRGGESTRPLDNEGAIVQYATPVVKHPNEHSSSASSETKSQYASLKRSEVPAANALSASPGYALLDPSTLVSPKKRKHPFASSTVLRSPNQVHPSGEGPAACTAEEREAGMRTSTGTSEGCGDHTGLNAHADGGCRGQLQQERDNENYDHVQNASCTPGVVPVLVLGRDGDAEVDETVV